MSMSDVGNEGDVFTDLPKCSPPAVRPDDSISDSNTPTKTDSAKLHDKLIRKLGLPVDPRDWSPTNLSLYIGDILSSKNGGTFPDPVIRDIQLVLIRERMNGKSFLRLTEEDLVRLGINPVWRPKFLLQAHRLRRRVVDGLEDSSPIASPSHARSEASGSVFSSTPSPRGPKMERQQQDISEKKGETGWLARAMSGPSSPTHHKRSDDSILSHSLAQFSGPIGGSKGSRVRGLVASYERTLSSDDCSSSTHSDDGLEQDMIFYGRQQSEGGLSTSLQTFPTGTVEEDGEDTTFVVPTESGQTTLPDSVVPSTPSSEFITPDSASIHTGSPPGYYEGRSSPPPPSHLDEASLSFPLKSSAPFPALGDEMEPTMDELIKNAEFDEEDENAALHHWLEGTLAGQTAHKITLSKPSKISSKSQQIKMGSAPLGKLFTPISEKVSRDVQTLEIEAPTTYESKAVEAVPLEPISSPKVMELIESFRIRLEAAERRLDELEAHDAARLEQKQRVLPEAGTQKMEAGNQTINELVDKGTQSESQRCPAASRVQPPTNVVPSMVELPTNLSQYLITASLGVAVIIAQTVFKRLMLKRT